MAVDEFLLKLGSFILILVAAAFVVRSSAELLDIFYE